MGVLLRRLRLLRWEVRRDGLLKGRCEQLVVASRRHLCHCGIVVLFLRVSAVKVKGKLLIWSRHSCHFAQRLPEHSAQATCRKKPNLWGFLFNDC